MTKTLIEYTFFIKKYLVFDNSKLKVDKYKFNTNFLLSYDHQKFRFLFSVAKRMNSQRLITVI